MISSRFVDRSPSGGRTRASGKYIYCRSKFIFIDRHAETTNGPGVPPKWAGAMLYVLGFAGIHFGGQIFVTVESRRVYSFTLCGMCLILRNDETNLGLGAFTDIESVEMRSLFL